MTTTTPTGWIFSQTPIWITCDPRISDSAYRLFVYLAWRQGHDAHCWPSRARIARDLGVSRETVRRRLRELEQAGYLVTRRRIGTSNAYTVVPDPDGASRSYTPHSSEPSPPTVSSPPSHNSAAPPPTPLRGSPRTSEPSPHTTLRGTPHRPVPHDDTHGREKRDRERMDRKKENKLAAVWPSMLSRLSLQVTQATFDACFADAAAHLAGDSLIIELPTCRAADVVSHRLHATITRTARRLLGDDALAVVYCARNP